MNRKRRVLLITLALTGLLEWQEHGSGGSGRHTTSVSRLLLPGAAAQGLTDGGVLGGQSCDAARLEEFDDVLLLSDEYSGGRSSSKGGSHGPKNGRKLLQGLLSDSEDTTATVTAAAMTVPRTNATCRGRTSTNLEAAFHVATAPDAFYPQSPVQLPWVRDQGDCASCVGHAVAACAEASLAAFTGAPARQYNFSGGSLYYCGSGGRTCNTAWTVAAAMDAVRQDASILRTCQDVTVISQGVEVRRVCEAAAARCAAGTNRDALLPATAAPVCAVVPAIDSIAQIQLRIRQHGAVVSRLNVNNPELFQQFFNETPRGVFNDTSACMDWSSCGQPFGHAILLVGYNNTASHWIAQSTWAEDFADGGRFRIAYGIAGVGSAPDTYALACQPQDRREQRRRRLPLVPLTNGCYKYTVDTQRTPHLSAVAAALNINITELVRNNTAAAPLFQTTEVVSWQPAAANSSSSDQPADYGCWSQPDCTQPVPVEGCLLSVVNQTDQAGDASSCNMTWLQPNLSTPLVNGTQLKVCNIPDVTWKGADERLSGSAAPVCPAGQQPDESGGCTECLPGTFKDSEGHEDCSTCAAGTFQSRLGATRCDACPAGSTSAEDVPGDHNEESDCGCPPGQVLASLVAGAAPTDDGCMTCPDDTYKPWMSAGPCVACPFGSVARGDSPAAHDDESDCTAAFTQLSTGLDTCGIIAADGSLRCFYNASNPSADRPIIPSTLQSARWLQIVHRSSVEGTGRVICGLIRTERSNSSGVLKCFGTADYVSAVPPKLNQTLFSHLAGSDSHICGVTVNGGLMCFSDEKGLLPLPAMVGLKFVDVAVGGGISNDAWTPSGATIVCGIVMGDRSLVCVDVDNAESALLTDASEAWQAVQVGRGGQVCGLTAAGDLLCLLRGVEGGFLQSVDLPQNLTGAKYKSFGLSGNFLCAALLRAAGISCWSSRSNQPRLVPGSENIEWASVTVDAAQNSMVAVVCAIASSSLAGRCWDASMPFLGTGINMHDAAMPPASSLSQWHQLDVAGLATCGIRTAGRTLLCVGVWILQDDVVRGTVGVPLDLANVSLSAVSLSNKFACVILAKSGRLKCFGSEGDPWLWPKLPSNLSDVVFDSISTGLNNACGVLSGSRKLVCWGSSGGGVGAPQLLPSAAVESAACGTIGSRVVYDDGSSCCAMLAGATGKRIVCWRYDVWGAQMTLDTENLKGWTGEVAVGNQSMCAVQSSKPYALACWISGDGTRSKATQPPASVGNRDWRSVSLAVQHACGVRRNGRAYCWPLGGQLPKGGLDKLASDLGEFGTVRDVQAGRVHTCILTAGQGNIRCFGLNSNGQAPDMLIA